MSSVNKNNNKNNGNVGTHRIVFIFDNGMQMVRNCDEGIAFEIFDEVNGFKECDKGLFVLDNLSGESSMSIDLHHVMCVIVEPTNHRVDMNSTGIRIPTNYGMTRISSEEESNESDTHCFMKDSGHQAEDNHTYHTTIIKSDQGNIEITCDETEVRTNEIKGLEPPLSNYFDNTAEIKTDLIWFEVSNKKKSKPGKC